MWTDEWLPASDMHTGCGGLSEQQKRHTDFFRINGYTYTIKLRVQSAVTVICPLDRLFEKKKGGSVLITIE